MLKNIMLLGLLTIVTSSVSIYATNYQLQSASIGAGGDRRHNSNYVVHFQQIAPVFSTVHKTNSHQMINGSHFDSNIMTISGYDDTPHETDQKLYDRHTVTLNALSEGITTQKVQFQVVDQNNVDIAFDNNIDNQGTSNWKVHWESRDSINEHEIVSFNVRAFDGLSWGKWTQSNDRLIVDNKSPIIDQFNSNHDFLSPTNVTSVGIHDIIKVVGELEEPFLHYWEINVLDNEGNHIITITTENYNLLLQTEWAGLDVGNNVVDEGVYELELMVQDKSINKTYESIYVTLDDTSPTITDLELSIYGKALNSQKVDLQTNWELYDEFDSAVEVDLLMNNIDPNIRSYSSLVIWLDSQRSNFFNVNSENDILSWFDKSVSLNHVVQNDHGLLPEFIEDNGVYFERSDELTSTYSLAPGNYVVLYIYDENGTTTLVEEAITFAEESPFVLSGLLGIVKEVMVFTSNLTPSENSLIEHYLSLKWQLINGTDFQEVLADSANLNFDILNEADNELYQMKLIATDKAGNKSIMYTDTQLAPDRTAPNISYELVNIDGVEDEDFVINLDGFKLDNYDGLFNLTWQPRIIYSDEDPIKSSEELLTNVEAVNDGYDISFILSPNANVDPDVAINVGNIYGKSEAWIELTLMDSVGNYSTKEIELTISPVNDDPQFSKVIGNEVTYDSLSQLVYNIKFYEDSVAPTFYLEDVIIDVDNLIENIAVDISEIDEIDSIYSVHPIDSSTIKYRSNYMNVFIGDETTNHQLNVTPTQNWYGDQQFTLRLTDPGSIVVTQAITVRVWPVNDVPIIKQTLVTQYQVNEDNNLIIDLNPFETDQDFEDLPPTYNNLLNWTVSHYDESVISIVEGEESANDVLTFVPLNNVYGTTNIELVLTDTDSVAANVFPAQNGIPGYQPNPLSVTTSVTLVWYPVNDAPVIEDVTEIAQDEDVGLWQYDLTSLKSDIEDVGNQLKWTVSLDEQFIDYSYDHTTNIITFESKDNVWGSTDVSLTLLDSDDNINFQPYQENPIRVNHTLQLVLNPINDEPSLDSVGLQSTITSKNSIALTYDVLSAEAIGYSDIGYTSDSRINGHLGDEYSANRDQELGFDTNVKNYNFRWYIDGELVQSRQNITSDVDYFNVDDSMEGKQLLVEVFPFDGELNGDVFTVSMNVNNRPSMVKHSSTLTLPTLNHYFNVQNVGMNWEESSDSENDDIYYRLKVWQVDKWDPQPEDLTLESSSFYDSGWGFYLDKIDEFTSLDHSTYYWKVWTADQISTGYYDILEPDWVKSFHVDLVYVNELDDRGVTDFIQIDNIDNNVVFEDSGNTRVLYGEKPTDVDDDYQYKIQLEYENEMFNSNLEESVVSTGVITVIDYTNKDTWFYVLTYPLGVTTYNVYLIDLAENRTLINTFIIQEDLTPPIPLEINGIQLSSIEAVTSKNMYFVRGEKEIGSSIYYYGDLVDTGVTDDAQLVGYTNTEDFSFYIFPEKPAGILRVMDKSGNVQSVQPYVDVTFLNTIANVEVSELSKTIFNSEENTQKLEDFGLSSDQIDNLTTVTFNVSSDRFVDRYELINSNGNVIVSGVDIEKNTTFNVSFNASQSTLLEGENVLTLNVYDIAGNVVTNIVECTMISTPPSFDVFESGSELFKLDGSTNWTVRLLGKFLENNLIFVSYRNSQSGTISDQYQVTEVNDEYWVYVDSAFVLNQNDILVTVIDNAYNYYTQAIWDATYYDTYVTNMMLTDITIPISELSVLDNSLAINLYYADLPDDIASILVSQTNVNSLRSLVLSSQLYASLSEDQVSEEWDIPDYLESYMVDIVAKNKQGQIVYDVDLNEHHVMLALEYPEMSNDSYRDLILLYYDSMAQQWLEYSGHTYVDTEKQKLFATIEHTGVFRLAILNSFVANLESLAVYPNPWIPADGDSNTGDDVGVYFNNLTSSSEIFIYSLTGELVEQIQPISETWIWNGTNKTGQSVFSGVYLYVIKDEYQTKTGKLTVVR